MAHCCVAAVGILKKVDKPNVKLEFVSYFLLYFICVTSLVKDQIYNISLPSIIIVVVI